MALPRHDPRYVALLALICLAILWIGTAVRPRGPQGDAPAPGVAGDLLQLERIAQRRDVELIAEYFSYIASQVEDSVVLLGGSGRSGVIWRSGEVLTSGRLGPFPSGDRTVFSNREVELATQRAGPHLPYVLFETPLAEAAASNAPVRLYAPGAWLLAVWRSRDGSLRYLSGNLFGVVERPCGEIELSEVHTNLDFGAIQPGAGIFALDGNLIAVALECEGQLIAAEAEALASRIRSEPTFAQRLMTRYGMRAETASDAEARFLGQPSGVLITDVWWGYRAHQAGLRPGDCILSVNGTPVESPADLEVLVLPVSLEVHDLAIWRAKRRRRVRLVARAATETASSTLGFVSEAGGFPIATVMPNSVAAQAGARAGDRLMAVNQRPAEEFGSLEAAFRDAGSGPAYLVLERRGRMRGVLVQVDE